MAKSLTAEAIISAMNEAGGDYGVASAILDCNKSELSQKICKNQQLRALYIRTGDKEIPNETEQMIRDISDAPKTKIEEDMVDAIQTQNMDILQGGLSEAGLKPETIAKLQTLGKFEQNAGKFLVSSLDMMHRMVVYNGATLFEHTEYMKKKLGEIEKDPSTSLKDWIAVQRCFNTTVEQLMKSYDRVLTGTQVMAKLSGGGKKQAPAKPGFTPLKNNGG
jgi:hypothetical protein|tara:strand:- start:22622 stop:23281 length:660 start_codon:yes stop_codon:yes gene_type:complete